MVSVYIAAPWVDRVQARVARDAFIAAGIEVTSHWLDIDRVELNHLSYDEMMAQHADILAEEAVQDLDDVFDADALVLYNTSKSEGKASELGYALAFHIPIVIVGERKGNIFYVHPAVAQVPDTEAAIAWVKENV